MKISIWLLSMLVSLAGIAQADLSLKIKDDWYLTYGSNGLKVGDTMPGIQLKMVNVPTGKSRLADFKGKLVILDFWSTSCSVCIDDFPYMESLQKQFGDKIQIILTNPFETQEQIQQRFNGRYKGRIKIPDLPSIVANYSWQTWNELLRVSSLFKAFPCRSVPLHVWIDGKGIIRLIGGHENTYPDKIKDLLAGKEIDFIYGSTAPNIPNLSEDKKVSYYKVLGSLKHTPVSYGSFITPYNNELNGNINVIIDSITNTQSRYFINQDLLYLYEQALSGTWKIPSDVLYCALPFYNGGGGLAVFSKGVDTANYSSREELTGRRSTDKDLRKSEYCYEQVVPLDLPDKKKRQYMLEDLNRYFEQRLGTTVVVEKRKIPCYVLVRLAAEDKISSPAGSSDESGVSVLEKDGKKLKKFTAIDLLSVFQLTIPANPELQSFLLQKKRSNNLFLLMNGTGWMEDKKVSLTLPIETLKTMDELNVALHSFGLGIVEQEREIEVMVIKQVK
ncbi:MAG: TlpA family protein disulfide reductase [Sphingobacteriia bacterium]|nr:TlpA family protein disulfide reductase [Sphingobacteriia bacterium]